MINRIKNNIKYICTRFTLIVSIVFGMISGVQVFIDWDTIGIVETKYKISVLVSLLAICGVIAFVWGIFFSCRRVVYSKDDVVIEVKYGDLMKIAFPKKKKQEKIVVIAVNRCFDMVVSQDLIYEGSVHGQFLKRYIHDDSERTIFETAIKRSLAEFDYEPVQLERSNKKYGNLDRYPLGSIARINGENGVTFFLLALTEFDKDCKAQCDKHQYVECLLKLFEYYDSHGQGKELYLYPMGTSMARTGLSRKESLDSTIMITKICKEHLKTKTTIIVDKRCKNEISITDI